MGMLPISWQLGGRLLEIEICSTHWVKPHSLSGHWRVVSLPYWHIFKLPHFQIFKLFPYLRYTLFEFERCGQPLPLQRQAGAQRKSRFFNRGSCKPSCRWPDVLWTGMTTGLGSTSRSLGGGR